MRAEQERVVGYHALTVASLLRDAMTRAAVAAGRFGIRALVVHALHDDARAFYLRHGLEPSPTDIEAAGKSDA